MRRLTITLRICAYAALTGFLFAVFMVGFLPAQARRLGSSVMADSAVTIAALFAADLEPAYAAGAAGGDQAIRAALRRLAGEAGASEAQRPGAQGLRVTRATVYSQSGERVAGYNDAEREQSNARPQRSPRVEQLEDTLRVAAPIFGDGDYKGFVSIDFSTATLSELAQHTVWGTLLASLVLGAALISVAFFVARSIGAPVERLAGAMRALARGEGDLTFRLQVEAQDEVGQLAEQVNLFLAKLQSVMREVADNATTLSASSDELARISDRLVENSQSMSDGASAVAERTHEVSSSIEAVAGAAQEATRNVSAVSNSTAQMSQNMAQVSLAAEAVASNAVEVEGSIRDISDAMATIRGNTEKAATVSRQGAEKATPVQQLLRELTQSAEATGKIVALIQKVADQTNLLSLNASIEAASAGDAGKGFAVVANEVKDLARETTEATKKIELQISDMQSFTRQSVGAIGQIIELMEGAHAINSAIAKAVEDQTQTSAKVFEATSDSTKMIADVTGNIGEASNMAAEVAGKASDLMRGISNISENAGKASRGALEVGSHIEAVRLSAVDSSNESAAVRKRSQELQELSTKLKSIVVQFRT
ncbi:MAG TPA: methyl-accepting chemotaxis protein [Myxococcota bacterium]|nr:methyl-accepting chemotaxis protein [Myxococcota bacterium]